MANRMMIGSLSVGLIPPVSVAHRRPLFRPPPPPPPSPLPLHLPLFYFHCLVSTSYQPSHRLAPLLLLLTTLSFKYRTPSSPHNLLLPSPCNARPPSLLSVLPSLTRLLYRPFFLPSPFKLVPFVWSPLYIYNMIPSANKSALVDYVMIT